MTFRTLIETADLAARLADQEVVVVDCRFTLDDESWGERAFHEAHVPGAVYAHLNRDLSDTPTGSNGRHPLPHPQRLAETFSRWGIAPDRQVVAYDQNVGSFASRLWWLLRWLGHDAVAVLDGGFDRWTAEGRPVEAGALRPRGVARFAGTPRPEMTMDVRQVAAHLGDSNWRLVDARAPERFRGDWEPLDPVAGHIPGAVNYFYRSNVDQGGLFRTPEDLRSQFESVLGGVPVDHAVSYCGSGVTACHNLLALEHAGLHGARLYAGSWSEWSSDPSRPAARGSAQADGPDAP
jgi:thiosulfate/3-mercaptopyruvate sulfurtransferase